MLRFRPFLQKRIGCLIRNSSLGACTLFHTGSSLYDMDLKSVIKILKDIAPMRAAESWDNVGLLVEPTTPPHPIEKVVITNDLTEQVLDEVLKMPGKKAGLVISYHPPIFKPLKRLTQSCSKERIVVRTLEAGLAIYSPHTSLDNMDGGINDWLLGGLGEGEVVALGIQKSSPRFSNVLELETTEMEVKQLRNLLSQHKVWTSTSPRYVVHGCV